MPPLSLPLLSYGQETILDSFVYRDALHMSLNENIMSVVAWSNLLFFSFFFLISAMVCLFLFCFFLHRWTVPRDLITPWSRWGRKCVSDLWFCPSSLCLRTDRLELTLILDCPRRFLIPETVFDPFNSFLGKIPQVITDRGVHTYRTFNSGRSSYLQEHSH